MIMITLDELRGTPASVVPFILEQMNLSDDGTVGFSLGAPYVAGLQLLEDTKSFEDDDYQFYDFLLDEEQKTITIDEETSGMYQLDELPQLIEYRLNKIWDSIE